MIFVFGVLLGGFFFLLHPSGRIVFFPPLAAQRTNRSLIPILFAFLATALAGNLAVLLTLSSEDVRGDGDEVGFYLAATAFLLCVTLFAFEFAGMSFRDDVAARRNPAAAATLCGLITGEGFCLAGSSSGNGPGIEAVLFCAAISTMTLFLAWVALDVLSGGIAERITVERDLAAGIRGGAFLAGAGAIAGGAVAGNWASFLRTVSDLMHFGWPIVILLVTAVGAEKALAKRNVGFSIGYSIIAFGFCVGYAVQIWGLT